MTYKQRIEYLSNPEKMNRLIYAYSIPTAEACIAWINDWVMTYDPRLPGDKTVPFDLYDFQGDYIRWLWDRYRGREEGAVEKSRDMGVSWGFIAFATWLMLFHREVSIGLFTYKAHECHKIGDISSLFGKIEAIIRNLPEAMRGGTSISLMYANCQRTGSDIAGSSGDHPGRGGRRSIYLLDESAFYVHAEAIYAAVGENSDCVISVSTHKGTDTVFYNKVNSGAIEVFRAPWHLHPLHTKEWYQAKRAKAEAEGLLHVFKREVEMDAGASVDSVVIPSDWVNAASLTEPIRGARIAALDVADEGGDTNALVIFDGNQIIFLEERPEGDPLETADWAFWKAIEFECDELRYDNIGIGAGVKGEIKKIKAAVPDDKKAQALRCRGWSAAGKVIRPDDMDYNDRENSSMFKNAKSQAWFRVREQFLQTYRAVNGKEHNEDAVLCLQPSENVNNALLGKVTRELSQPRHKLNESGQYLIDKKPKGAKSPNCFVAGTLVLTTDGEKPIETIQDGDSVITPFGIRKVVKTHKSLGRIISKCGLCGTEDHLLFSRNGMMTLAESSAHAIIRASIGSIIAWRIISRVMLSLTGSNIGFYHLVDTTLAGMASKKKAVSYFIMRYGKKNTVKAFLKVIASITSTGIVTTTELKTLLLCRIRIICDTIRWSGLKILNIDKETNCILRRSDQWPLRLTETCTRNKDRRKQLKDILGQWKKDRSSTSAQNAERSSCITCLKLSTVQKNAEQNETIGLMGQKQKPMKEYATIAAQYFKRRKRKRNIAVPHASGNIGDVYNLTIDRDTCFYANGILVKNCADAFIIARAEVEAEWIPWSAV